MVTVQISCVNCTNCAVSMFHMSLPYSKYKEIINRLNEKDIKYMLTILKWFSTLLSKDIYWKCTITVIYFFNTLYKYWIKIELLNNYLYLHLHPQRVSNPIPYETLELLIVWLHYFRFLINIVELRQQSACDLVDTLFYDIDYPRSLPSRLLINVRCKISRTARKKREDSK